MTTQSAVSATGSVSSTTSRRPRVTWASTIEAVPVVWAWRESGHGRIPAGSLSVMAGREGTGKSSCALWIAAQITRGTLPGTFYGRPRNVFYVAVEDSWQHTLVPRLIAAGADLSRVGRFDVIHGGDDEVTLSLPSDNDLLETAIKEHKVAAVVLDPLMSVMGAGIDTHKERDVRGALDPLAKIADRTGALILGIAHFGKSNSADPASLITGSGAFKNVPRTVFAFARDDAEEGTRVMSQVKNSLGRDDLPNLSYVIEAVDVPVAGGTSSVGRFMFTGQSVRSVDDIIRDSRTSATEEDHSEKHGAAQWLSDYLEQQGGQAPKKDIFKAARGEFAERTLQRAVQGSEFLVTSSGFPRTTTWSLAVAPPSDASSLESQSVGATGATVSDQGFHPDVLRSELRQFPQSRQSRQGSDTPQDGGVTAPMVPCDDCGDLVPEPGLCFECTVGSEVLA